MSNRLLDFQAACGEPRAGIDVLRARRTGTLLALAADPEPMEHHEHHRTDAELGYVLRLLAAGATNERIGEALGISTPTTARMVAWVRRVATADRSGRTGAKLGRPRRATPEQEQHMWELYAGGLHSVEDVAEMMHLTAGTVRYVLEHPREGRKA